MTVWSELGASARAAVVAAGTSVVAVTGWLVWPVSAPEPVAAVPEADTVEAPVDVAAVEAAPDATATATPAAAEPAVPALLPEVPRFDLVRVEPDGSATVAGRAAAGAVVSLRVDGIEVAQATADGQGKFASLFTLSLIHI